jgi:hypothetical protein
MVVWRAREDNLWVARPQAIVAACLGLEPAPPAPGPGPFSLADPDVLDDVLRRAGFQDVARERFDAPMRCGRDLEEAVDMAVTMGPAGELLREPGAAGRLEAVRAALREGLAAFDTPAGPFAPSSSWLVAAR